MHLVPKLGGTFGSLLTMLSTGLYRPNMILYKIAFKIYFNAIHKTFKVYYLNMQYQLLLIKLIIVWQFNGLQLILFGNVWPIFTFKFLFASYLTLSLSLSRSFLIWEGGEAIEIQFTRLNPGLGRVQFSLSLSLMSETKTPNTNRYQQCKIIFPRILSNLFYILITGLYLAQVFN